jgi:hypothetical protein
LEIGSIFKDKAEEEGISITDLGTVVVLVTGLLRQELNRLVKDIKPVELLDKG